MISRHEWQWFATFTFREAVHPEAADKRFRLWCALLDESHLGKRWRDKQNELSRARWVRGLEWQKRGVLHYHALLGNLPAFTDGLDDRLCWSAMWDQMAGFALIVPVAEVGGVAAYIAKYCSKGGEVDVSPNFGLRAPLNGSL